MWTGSELIRIKIECKVQIGKKSVANLQRILLKRLECECHSAKLYRKQPGKSVIVSASTVWPPCQLAWIWTEAPSYVNPPEVRTLRYHFEIESSWFYCWYHNNYNLLRMRYIAQIAWLKTRSVYSSETIPHTNWAIQRSNRPRINTSTD